MEVHILGAHNCESHKAKFVSLLIDDALAIDAGGLTSSLTFTAQQKLKAILLTHHHYDHTRDIPAIAMSLVLQQSTVNVYSTRTVYDNLSTHLFNGTLYPRLMEWPADNPIIKFNTGEPNKEVQIKGYSILPLPVNHAVPAVGYQVTSPEGKSMFFTGDTGPGLADCWTRISPELLIAETTAPNRYERFAIETGHLTPNLLKQELLSFRELKGYLPRVALVHMNPYLEKEIEAEVAAVARELNNPITLTYEGMRLSL